MISSIDLDYPEHKYDGEVIKDINDEILNLGIPDSQVISIQENITNDGVTVIIWYWV